MSALEDDQPDIKVLRMVDGTEVELSMEEFWELVRKEEKSSNDKFGD